MYCLRVIWHHFGQSCLKACTVCLPSLGMTRASLKLGFDYFRRARPAIKGGKRIGVVNN